MPPRIEPCRTALADFDAIFDYIARDHPTAVAEVLRALDRSIPVIDELAEELRLAMILLGCASIDAIGSALVHRGSAGHAASAGE